MDNATAITTQTSQVQQEAASQSSDFLGYAQLGFGFILVIFMFVLIFYYFSSKRKDVVESPKYDMMKDEDDDEVK